MCNIGKEKKKLKDCLCQKLITLNQTTDPKLLYIQYDVIFLGRVYMPPCNSSVYNQCEYDIFIPMTFKNPLSTTIGKFEPCILKISFKFVQTKSHVNFKRKYHQNNKYLIFYDIEQNAPGLFI